MRDRHDLARGWLAKADSDLVTARLVLDSPGPYDYDFDFWPDAQTAGDALILAEQVRRFVLEALPRSCHP